MGVFGGRTRKHPPVMINALIRRTEHPMYFGMYTLHL